VHLAGLQLSGSGGAAARRSSARVLGAERRAPTLQAGITGYTAFMAKVMISLPDELLARLDAQAAERGSTRSATLRDLAEAALGERERLLAERMTELEGHAGGHGGDVVGELKAGRPA
jgi:hypothetical protein